jgi:putative oxidoreductase
MSSETVSSDAGSAAASAGRMPRWLNITLWVLQILMAALYLMAGGSKLLGNPQMVKEFGELAVGQWFRYFTGCVEVTGAILMLIPRMCSFGGFLITATMIGAIIARITVLHGNMVGDFVLLLIAATIMWNRRKAMLNL